MPQITILPKTTFTSPGAGAGVSVAPVWGSSWKLVVQCVGSGADTIARLSIEDSLDGFASDILAAAVICAGNGVSAPAAIAWSLDPRNFPDLRVGLGGSELRVNVTRLSGTDPTVTLQAFLEY